MERTAAGFWHVFDALHTLEEYGHLGNGFEVQNVLPGEAGIYETGDWACNASRAVNDVWCFTLDVGGRIVKLGADVC